LELVTITNGILFNPFLLKFEEADVIIEDRNVIHIGDVSDFRVDREYNVKGLYVLPGFIDIHFHIESTFLLPHELSYEIVKHGTLTIVADPHEIANVFGLEGVLKLIEISKNLPLTIFYQIPSCVPASEFEDTPNKLGVAEWTRLMEEESVIAVGEVMSYNKLLSRDKELLKLMKLARERNLVIEGHCPRLKGKELSLYAYLGPNSDHTQMTSELIIERVRKGVFVEIQEKSLTEDVIETLKKLPAGTYAFVTDDVDAAKLVYEGHLDHILRKALKLGLEPEKAFYAATLAPANRMRLYDRGALTPGKIADVIVVSDLEQLDVIKVFKEGKLIYTKDRGFLINKVSHVSAIPGKFLSSIKPFKISSKILEVKAPISYGEINVNVIEVLPHTTFTRKRKETVKVFNSKVLWENTSLALAAVFNRYGYERYALGFVKGAILKKGAIATTYAHDSHNLLVLGRNVNDMVKAADYVVKGQGGLAVVCDNRLLAYQKLPVGGIMSLDNSEKVAKNIALIRETLYNLGYEHFDPIKSISTLTLTVSPELKITPRGLFDVVENRIINLFEMGN